MDQNSKSYVLALVYKHVKDSEEYTSYVAPYTVRRKRRRPPTDQPPTNDSYVPLWVGAWRDGKETVWVGGHLRRKALYARLLSALKRTTKFEDLTLI